MGHEYALRSGIAFLFTLASLLSLGACDAGPPDSTTTDEERFNVENCVIPTDRLVVAAPRDAIPALTNPSFVEPADRQARYLTDESRVIGLLFGEPPLAVPHNILWHHEIVNLRRAVVTYCPLTGSSLAFDRIDLDGTSFGVSGLLFNNNLVMFNRADEESLWPQMKRKAGCGPDVGTALEMLPVVEMKWGRWKTLYPKTKVVSSETGFQRDYTASGYPYFNYNQPNNRDLFQSMPIDDRRPPKERVLGIPGGQDGGLALPFGALNENARLRVVEVAVGASMKTIFWSREARGAMAFETSTSLSIHDNRIVDDDTGSTWTVDGRAVQGPRKGDRLEPVDKAYVAFWFAWAAFHSDTRLWTPSVDKNKESNSGIPSSVPS